MKFAFTFTTFFLLSTGIFGQDGKAMQLTGIDTVLTFDTLHRISGQFMFTEGPARDKYGNIYFTDQPRDQIWKYDTKGQLLLFMYKTGRSNGLFFDDKGRLLACADEHNELWSINDLDEKKVVLSGYQGKAFNGPNDLWIDQHGGIYFTDPYYQRDYWTRKKPELSFQGLFYLPKGSKEAILLDSTMTRPNGIVGDGKVLYVSDIGSGKTYRYRISGKGKLTDKQLFVSQGSDGMTLDHRGNLYLSGKGVTAFNPGGIRIFHLDVPSPWVGNLCFGGKKRNQLFITASESVYVISMRVKGLK